MNRISAPDITLSALKESKNISASISSKKILISVDLYCVATLKKISKDTSDPFLALMPNQNITLLKMQII